MRREGNDYAQPHVDPRAIMTDPARDARALAATWIEVFDACELPCVSGSRAIASAPPPEDNALSVPRAELLSRYRTVAVGPLGIGDLPRRAEVEQRYHELLLDKLRHLGFTVVGENDYAALWTAEAAAAKGFFDPFTGRIDHAKLRAAHARVFAQLHDKYPIDAVVLPKLAQRPAHFSHSKAHWDGVVEQVAAPPHGFAVFTDQTSQLIGTAQAASLVVRIADGDDTTLFEDRGGIQLMGRLIHGRTVDVPQAELFTDAARNAQAVEVALRQLAPPPPASPAK
jgi:hypothetical protein